MSGKMISGELRKWFDEGKLFDLTFEFDSNGMLTFHGSMHYVPEYEYQWMYKHNNKYYTTDYFYTKESDIHKPDGSSCWSRIGDSGREKR